MIQNIFLSTLVDTNMFRYNIHHCNKCDYIQILTMCRHILLYHCTLHLDNLEGLIQKDNKHFAFWGVYLLHNSLNSFAMRSTQRVHTMNYTPSPLCMKYWFQIKYIIKWNDSPFIDIINNLSTKNSVGQPKLILRPFLMDHE